MAGMDFLQYHARMLGHGKVPGAYGDGPFSFRGRTAVDTPGIPALLHLLQQNTIHLPAAPDYLVEHALGYLLFSTIYFM